MKFVIEVEVVYDAEHNVITKVRSFKYGHSLDKYAPKIEKAAS